MVVIAYSPFSVTGTYVKGTGRTNEEGEFAFTGSAFYQIFVSIEKQGYYPSRSEDYAYDYDESTKRKVPRNPQIELVLKEIRNPAPMVARANFEVVLARMDEPTGFDLARMDWVTPHGKGETADLYFTMTGHYRDRDDRSSTLAMSFPNPCDGVLEFVADQRSGSQLRSPHEAPDSGYETSKEWKRWRIRSVDARGEEAWTSFEEQSLEANYILRTRTVLDENGDVQEARYSKIYGDLGFFGYHPEGSYIHFDALYYNPRKNDRNLEFEVGRSLFEPLKKLEEPQLP